ncbi:MAG TPA: GNAT family N-acetyltransferase [Anaerolineaceae bacterium]|nr:GNAT family N-acetyltransferase [Anaerolineaceae bacterium]
MIPTILHDRAAIAAYLRQDLLVHLYELGDLDDFFWPYTTWYASLNHGDIERLALLYTGSELPILLATAAADDQPMINLLKALLPFLPRQFYAHLPAGMDFGFLRAEYQMESYGVHDKMALQERTGAGSLPHPADKIRQVKIEDLPELIGFYEAAYPGNWFDPRMIETGQYYGLWRSGRLVSVAGVHVYSPAQGVAALGNITTLPELRGSGLGTAVTGALCQALGNQVGTIGLNVRADNTAAIACYQKLGFRRVTQYEEWMLKARPLVEDRDD